MKRKRDQSAKRDEGKPRLDLIPWPAVLGVARVMERGLSRYAPHSWRSGRIEDTRLAAAAIRHLVAWLSGADADHESGLPHLDHAAANVLMLSSRISLGVRVDDRFSSSPTAAPPGLYVEPYVEPASEPISLSSSVAAYTARCATAQATPRASRKDVDPAAHESVEHIGGGYDLTDG